MSKAISICNHLGTCSHLLGILTGRERSNLSKPVQRVCSACWPPVVYFLLAFISHLPQYSHIYNTYLDLFMPLKLYDVSVSCHEEIYFCVSLECDDRTRHEFIIFALDLSIQSFYFLLHNIYETFEISNFGCCMNFISAEALLNLGHIT